MKSIVLDGERIAEAIQKTRDNMINGEYDNNDLILRGDALKAIRQKCISEHLPFKSNTPEGERVLEALVAVHQVKPYKETYEDTKALKLSYRGYTATIEYDDDDKLWHGKLDKIHDMINFHSFKAEEIEREFHNAVNDYLDFCKEIGKKPEEPHD